MVQLFIVLTQMVTAFFFPLETLFLWWLPLKIITSYLGLVFSREPHNGLEIGRHSDTRFWRNGLPRFLNHSCKFISCIICIQKFVITMNQKL